jgi:hypothetical protein
MEKPKRLSTELARLGKKLRVEIGPHWDHPNVVRSVRFRFPKRTWACLANKEDELLQACCANISAIRDEIISAMREDGWLDMEDMQRIVVNMEGHEFEQEHPVSKIKEAYLALEPYADLKGRVMSVDPNDVRDCCAAVWFGKTWAFCAEYTGNSMFSNWGQSLHDQASHNRSLFQILPIIKCLYEKAHETGFPPLEGWAIVRQANGEVYEMRRGFAIFETKKEAKDVLDRWFQSKSLENGSAKIVAARVSLEKGVELIDEVGNPWVPPEMPVPRDDEEELRTALNDLRGKNKHDKVDDILKNAIKQIQAITS